GKFVDGDGNVLETQCEKDVTYVQVKNVPAMGHRAVFFRGEDQTGEETSVSTFKVNGRKIETPFYQMIINEQGQIEKLYDKEYGRNVLAPNERGNVLQMFEDKPLDNDAWD